MTIERHFRWLLVALAIIFHRQSAQGFTRITRVSFDPRKQRIAIEFGRRISPASPGAALLGGGGALRGKRVSIDRMKYRIGRKPDNDLYTAADDTSGTHASLRYEKGGLFLADERSLNGTYLNEQRIAATPVLGRQGDRIQLGECVFEVVGSAG